MIFNYEKRKQPVASRKVFYARLSRNLLFSLGIVAVSLVFGTWGYSHFEGMATIDAFANASMILSGMGPMGELHTWSGKVFASFYAIASGLLLFALAGLILAPIYHRILHRFHVDLGDDDAAQAPPARRRRRH
jgi:hypothetical protein